MHVGPAPTGRPGQQPGQLRPQGSRPVRPVLSAVHRRTAPAPVCARTASPCSASRGRDHAVIEHPPGCRGAVGLGGAPGPARQLGPGAHAHLLVGALPFSGRWRGVLANTEDLSHLAQGLHQVSVRLGGLPKRWRFDADGHRGQPGDRAGSPRVSRRWPSTTGSGWTCAHRGTATARAAWRRPTTAPRNAGGGRAAHHRGSPGEPADNDTTGATLSAANGRSSRRPALTDGLIRQRRQATLRP